MNDSPPDDSRQRDAEAQMRRALGLDINAAPVTDRPPQTSPSNDPHQPRRRQFVRDGDVPVVVIRRDHRSDGDANQLDAARQAIRSQAAAREHAERSLEQAQAQVHDLQTKLGHERLAKDEAIARAHADRRALEQALETVRVELAGEKSAREHAEQALRDARSTVSNLSEKLHTAQQALTTVKAELDAERLNAVEGARTTIAAPATDASSNGEEPVQTVRRPRGRPRKLAVEKPDGDAQALFNLTDAMKDRKKGGAIRQPKSKPIKWWLGER